MTLKLERSLEGDRITIRLIGRVQSAHLDEISDQMARAGSEVGLDLEDVTIVDVEVVLFLGTCERNGTPLLHCPRYVREWISREGERS
jgi:hypothetical protein